MEAELQRLFERVSRYFALLAEPTRLKILHALCDGELNVTDIVATVDSTQTNVSRHLNLMYAKGVLARRREGAMTVYSIADANVVSLCRAVCTQLASLDDEKALTSRTVRRFMPQ